MPNSIDAARERIAYGLLALAAQISRIGESDIEFNQKEILTAIDSLLADEIEPAVAMVSGPKKIGSQDWLVERAFAQHLHGSVQGALIAARAAVGIASPSALAERIRDIERGLQSTISVEQNSAFDFHRTMAKYISLWDGVLPISLSVDDTAVVRFAADNKAAQGALEVVKEAINNSVKHGTSTRIDVRVTGGSRGELELEVISFGTRLKRIRKPGFGTLIYEALTDRWELSRVDGGVRLWCELRVTGSI